MNILEFKMMIGKKIIEMCKDIKYNKWLPGSTQEITIDGKEYKISLKNVEK